MPVILTPADIALRVLAALAASALVGLNRGKSNRPAGLRTTILVSMAAAFAMLLCNAILNTTGKTNSFFTTMDTMRLPLGVLTGVGFLGAGAILRKGHAVVGLTTAATLWFVTVMGFCFGAGMFLLGGTALLIALFVLWALKIVEHHMHTDRRGSLTLTFDDPFPDQEQVKGMFEREGFRVAASCLRADGVPRKITFTYELRWSAAGPHPGHPRFIDELLSQPGIAHLAWDTESIAEQSEGEA